MQSSWWLSRHGLQPPAQSSTSLPLGRRLAVWQLQCRRGISGLVALQYAFWSQFPYKINIATPRSKGAEQYSDGLPGMGFSPQREAPQVFLMNGAGPFGGCNPAAVSSALSLCNPFPGLGFLDST